MIVLEVNPDPRDLAKVDVIMRDVDIKRRISLGYKQTQPNPLEKYRIHSKVPVRITSIVDDGAFAELEKGIEGWIHKSELSWTEVSPDPRDFFSEGDEVDMIVLEVNPDPRDLAKVDVIMRDVDIKRRISLGYKQTQPNPLEKYSVGSEVWGTITKIVDDGAFVKLADNIEGFIDKSQINPNWDKGKKIKDSVFVNQGYNLKVLGIDKDNCKIKLSLKAILEAQILAEDAKRN